MIRAWPPLLGIAALLVSGDGRPVPENREQAARAVLEAALQRLGGADFIREQRHWFVAGNGEENLSAELQGLTPDRPTVRPHEEWLGVDAATEAVAWERRTPRNDQSLRWRRLIYRGDSTGFIVWTDTTAVMNAGAAPITRRRGLMRRIPHLLLLEAATSDSLMLGSSRAVLDKRHREVRVFLDGVWISLWVSADSSLLSAAEYRSELPGRGTITTRWEWFGWQRDAGGVLKPGGHNIVVDGRTYQHVEYRRFETASRAADSLLHIPNEVRARPRTMPTRGEAATTLPASGEVAPGVHVEQIGGFNTFIVEFADFVLLVEAPAAAPGFEAIPATRAPDRIAGALSARVQEIARGRPLGYTVITHAHSDHIGNATAVASLTRRFLLPPDARELVRAGNVDIVLDQRTISDSTRSVVIYNVGENPHTAHNLFVWLPRERIGFQGDLFYYEQGAPDIPGDRRPISVFFARWLREKELSPRAVYGVHNFGAAGSEILRRVLER